MTTDRTLAETVARILPKVADEIPDPALIHAAWRDHGEIVLCEDCKEVCRVADAYAPEHLQVIADDHDWWRANLRSYGSLFLGEGATVTHGDKCSGTNHILPPRQAARYSGGLNVQKFLKVLTWQELDEAASITFSGGARAFPVLKAWKATLVPVIGTCRNTLGTPTSTSRSIASAASNDRRFTKPFTQQEPIPEAAIAQAVEIMQSGRLHRYNVAEGEVSEASLLEQDYAAWQGVRYCLACTLGGQAIQSALRAAGVKPGDAVLANAYTLAPVPGALHAAGARPVLVEIDQDWHTGLADLETKAQASGARFFLLSHIRGHIADMEAVMAVCERHGIVLIEDCAHTMGARWNSVRSGNHGRVACFSAQTYKHINSGGGGLLTTDDPELACRAIVHSGCYMLYGHYGAAPD